MPITLKLNTGGGGPNPQPPTPSAAPPPSGGGFKLKLSSQPPTPALESGPPGTGDDGATKKRRNYARKDDKLSANKKRAANDDLASPAAKRIASGAGDNRRSSIILKAPRNNSLATPTSATPGSAKPRISLKSSRQPSAIVKRLHVKGRIPERVPGNGYDSEDSEREKDPAVEQQLILRMQPGEDCDYLRDAITNRTIGMSVAEGGADVQIKFLDKDGRRAVVTIKGKMYAAALVDLPCIVETMKSWDKKGWWKVADIHQMLLVLGRCSNDAEARHMALPPRVVNPHTLQYAHGLTPPMHWVRKRRFRKRLSYRDTANVEEEVQKLLDADDAAVRSGGSTKYEIVSRESLERSMEPEDDYDHDAEGEAMDTIEDEYEESPQHGMDEDDVDFAQAAIEASFLEDNAAQQFTAEPVVDSPAAIPDTAVSFNGGLQSTVTSPGGGVQTPQIGNETPAAAETPAQEASEASSDEDESDSGSDSDDVIDEDDEARRLERAQQMEEVHDLEREVEIQKQKLVVQKNQLLREKTMKQLRSLEEDLRIKRAALGLDDEVEE